MTSKPTGERGYCRRCTIGVWFVEEFGRHREIVRCAECRVSFTSGALSHRVHAGKSPAMIYVLAKDAPRFSPNPIVVKPGDLVQ